MLSRKYYRLIAKVIKGNTERTNFNMLDKEGVINDLAMHFKADNGLFCASKFVDACD